MSSIGALSLRIPVRSPTLIGLDFSLTTLVKLINLITFASYLHTENQQEQSLSDYVQQDLFEVAKRSPLHMQML
jgi:hypothetical protein